MGCPPRMMSRLLPWEGILIVGEEGGVWVLVCML